MKRIFTNRSCTASCFLIIRSITVKSFCLVSDVNLVHLVDGGRDLIVKKLWKLYSHLDQHGELFGLKSREGRMVSNWGCYTISG